MFAVGIGGGISEEGLEEISGSKDRVIKAKNFADIGNIAKTILQGMCKAVGECKAKRVNGKLMHALTNAPSC